MVLACMHAGQRQPSQAMTLDSCDQTRAKQPGPKSTQNMHSRTERSGSLHHSKRTNCSTVTIVTRYLRFLLILLGCNFPSVRVTALLSQPADAIKPCMQPPRCIDMRKQAPHFHPLQVSGDRRGPLTAPHDDHTVAVD